MGNRRDVLAALKTILEEISEIETVVRTYLETDFDITQYATDELPLIAIPEPLEDTYEEMTSQRSMMSLGTKLIVYFVDWAIDPDATIYEALIKLIRDKIGGNFTLNDKATEARIMSVSSVLGTMPVYNFVMELEMKYYLDEQVT
jgi:hypothetical protein